MRVLIRTILCQQQLTCVNPIYTLIIHRLYIGSTHVDIDHT